MSCKPCGGQVRPEQKQSFSVMVWFDPYPKLISGGVYRSALILVFSTGPRYCNGNVRHISLSHKKTKSEPVRSRGGKNEPATNRSRVWACRRELCRMSLEEKPSVVYFEICEEEIYLPKLRWSCTAPASMAGDRARLVDLSGQIASCSCARWIS